MPSNVFMGSAMGSPAEVPQKWAPAARLRWLIHPQAHPLWGMRRPKDIDRIPRLAYKATEAPFVIGVSPSFFAEHVRPEVKWIRRGRLMLVPITELQRWLEENAS